MEELKEYIKNRRKVLKELIEHHDLDIDRHRLDELEQLEKIVYPLVDSQTIK